MPELRETPEGKKWQAAMTFKFVGILELTKDPTKDVVTDPNVDPATALAAAKAKAAANAAKAKSTTQVMVYGIFFGVIVQAIRKVLQKNKGYQAWRTAGTPNKVIDFIIDAIVLASPYASSFGGFVEFPTALWFGLGGIFASIFNWVEARRKVPAPGGSSGEGVEEIEDMSTTSLVGGGLIAGESLYALYLGIAGLIASGALVKMFGG